MLKTTNFIFLSLCLILFSNVIQKIQAQDDADRSDPNAHADYNDAAPHEPHEPPAETAAPPGPPAPAPEREDHPPPPAQGHEPGQQTYRDEYAGPADGFGENDHGFTDVTRTTDKEERKLTPEMVEKFTAPLLENRWKWDYRREALVKNFWFASFNEAFGFMARVALRAEKIRHHPEWYNSLNRVKVTLWTNKVNGLTYKDIIMARFIDKTEQFFEKKPPPAHLAAKEEYYAHPDQAPNPPPQEQEAEAFQEGYSRTRATTVMMPLTDDEEKLHVSPLIRRGWVRDKTRDSLRKDFTFQSFYGAFSFMTQIAMLSEKIGHFPDWFNVNKKVKITLNSKRIKGLSMKDVLIAKFADKMYNSQKFL